MYRKFRDLIDLSTHDLTRRSTQADIQLSDTMELSTHDLTRRSTKLMEELSTAEDLSTHDLTRRSTGDYKLFFDRFLSFNSRPHKEVDTLI